MWREEIEGGGQGRVQSRWISWHTSMANRNHPTVHRSIYHQKPCQGEPSTLPGYHDLLGTILQRLGKKFSSYDFSATKRMAHERGLHTWNNDMKEACRRWRKGRDINTTRCRSSTAQHPSGGTMPDEAQNWPNHGQTDQDYHLGTIITQPASVTQTGRTQSNRTRHLNLHVEDLIPWTR